MTDARVARRGRIDEVEGLAEMDLIAFNGGVNPFHPNRFIDGGFKAGATYYRDIVARWGFMGKGDVADIGSGYGRWSLFLAEVNDRVRSFERNGAAVELSRKLAAYFDLPNVTFEVADIGALPADAGSFDGVWCYNVMQFVDRATTLREVHRVLKPGGVLHLGVYNGAGRVLEKFFQGYALGGLSHHTTKFAFKGLKEGPLFDGRGNYASAESVEPILRRFGFALSPHPPLDVEMSPKARKLGPDRDDVADLPALAGRLESDLDFAAEFAKRPELAYAHPINLHFCAVKV